MDLFNQVKKDRKKIDQKKIINDKNKTKKNKPEKKSKEKKEENFNNLEQVDKKIKEEVSKENLYFFDYNKHNLFSIYLNCNKFISNKPYFDFQYNKDQKKIFLSNDDFNDFFAIEKNKIIINLNDQKTISYVVKNFIKELKNNKIKFIQIYGKNILLDYFLDLETSEDGQDECHKYPKCFVCPFYDLDKCNL